MTPEKKAKQLAKRAARKANNVALKASKAAFWGRRLAQQGQMCVMAEKFFAEQNLPVDYDQVFNPQPQATPSINRLVWLNGKMYKQSLGGRKNVPSNKADNLAAYSENASRDFAKQVDIALNPPAVALEAQ